MSTQLNYDYLISNYLGKYMSPEQLQQTNSNIDLQPEIKQEYKKKMAGNESAPINYLNKINYYPKKDINKIS